jgi:four helix bundle protein
VAWQLCVELDSCILEITTMGPVPSDVEWRDQIRASAGSAAPNIAEGFSRVRPREFVRCLRLAVASLRNTSAHLDIGEARGYLAAQTHSRASALCGGALQVTTRLLNTTLRQLTRDTAERSRRTERTSAARSADRKTL